MYKKKLLLMSLLIGLPLVYGSDKEVELKEEFI